MGRNNSIEEAIFTLYLKKYPEVIEDVIGLPIEGIKIEENVGGKRWDFYAVNRGRRIEIIVENQKKKSDKNNHLSNKITPIINNISEGYILWIAKEFKKDHIDEIIELLRNNPHKYINFYAIEIQPKVLNCIKYLNNCYELDIWDELDIINKIEEKVKVIAYHLQMPETHIGRAYIEENHNDFESDYSIMKYMMRKICEGIPYYPNAHYSKKILQDNKQITYGGGIGSVTYFCSIPSKKRRDFVVGIRFEWSVSIAYQYFKEKEELLKERISPKIYFDDKNRKINLSIKTNRHNFPVIADQIVEMLERFILFFSPYTYGGKIKDITNPTEDKNAIV